MKIIKYNEFILEAKKVKKNSKDWRLELADDMNAHDENYNPIYTPEQIYNKYRDLPEGEDIDDTVLKYAVEGNFPNYIEWWRQNASPLLSDGDWFDLLNLSFNTYGYRSWDCTHELIELFGVDKTIKVCSVTDNMWRIVEYCMDEFPTLYDKKLEGCILAALGYHEEYNWLGASQEPAVKNLKRLIELNALLDNETLKILDRFEITSGNENEKYSREDIIELLFKTIDEVFSKENDNPDAEIGKYLSHCDFSLVKKLAPKWFYEKYEWIFEINQYSKNN